MTSEVEIIASTKSKDLKPPWLRVRAPSNALINNTNKVVRHSKIVTVCEEASCPNIGECWSKSHATFMLLGRVCTRACAFCDVASGIPDRPDPSEPRKIAQAVVELGLSHVVVTSVDRDDLTDGGAAQFVRTIESVRSMSPDTTIEVLTPDFRHASETSVNMIVNARPDVFNHNIETVPRLYRKVRPGARYFHSMRLLERVKELDPAIMTKSGLMLGMGENKSEVLQVMDDMRDAGVDFLTLGQYLSPSEKHHPVERYVTPKEFEAFKSSAIIRKFSMVASSPLTRSSYHAGEEFKRFRQIKKDGKGV